MSNESKSVAVPEENKMGVMPVGRLLFSMSLPMMLSMLVQALYNIVDSIFVAKLSEDALSAVSLAFPLQTLIFAVGGGTCVGVNALLSRALGEKDFKKANDVAMNGAFLTVLSYVVFLILGLTVVKPFYVGQLNGTSSPIYGMGVDYLSTVMIFSIGVFCQMYFERLLTSAGKTVYTMLSQLTGAVINIILDPILIFGLLGAPAMGRYFCVFTTYNQHIAGFFNNCIAILPTVIRNQIIYNQRRCIIFFAEPDFVRVNFCVI